MERRTDAVELLDGPLDDPAALAGNLRDLRRVNRWLGGVRLSADAIDALAAHREQLTVLDVGTGGADIPLALLDAGGRRGRGLAGRRASTAGPRSWRRRSWPDRRVDRDAGAGAARRRRALAALPRRLVRRRPRLAGPPPPQPDEAVAPARARWAGSPGSASSSTTSIRSRLGWLGAWLLGHLLTRNRYTRHDAPLSVRRAYPADELTALLRTAGLTPVAHGRRAFGQRYAIAAVPTPAEIAIGHAAGSPGSRR